MNIAMQDNIVDDILHESRMSTATDEIKQRFLIRNNNKIDNSCIVIVL